MIIISKVMQCAMEMRRCGINDHTVGIPLECVETVRGFSAGCAGGCQLSTQMSMFEASVIDVSCMTVALSFLLELQDCHAHTVLHVQYFVNVHTRLSVLPCVQIMY